MLEAYFSTKDKRTWNSDGDGCRGGIPAESRRDRGGVPAEPRRVAGLQGCRVAGLQGFRVAITGLP